VNSFTDACVWLYKPSITSTNGPLQYLKGRDYLETKTHYILFQKKQSRQETGLKIPIKNREIVNVKSTNFLGVPTESNLNSEAHIERSCCRISR
jgi:hypothetical protein